ncbi:MAG: chemotaxis protein CheW [Lysobacteraceae bacterium]
MGSAKRDSHPFDVLLQYEQASLSHDPGRPEQVEVAGHWRGVGFRLGDRRLVSAYDEVIEILHLPSVTPVPGASSWMLGVANLRGTLLPVVDLRQFLEGERTVLHENQRILLVRQPGGDVAVLIDELYGQRGFGDANRAEPGSMAEGRYGHFIQSAYESGGVKWGVFSMNRLTRTPEFRQAAA